MHPLSALAAVIIFALALAAAVLLLIFVLVPLFRGAGWLLMNLFRGIGWLFMHLFEFVFGMIGDALRFVGSFLAMLVLSPLVVLNVVLGRWSAAGHFTNSIRREGKVGGAALYRVALRRPLKLVMLHGLLEGVEQRVPEAMAAAPAADRPRHRTGQFEGYRIVGSLRGGGSGAQLYVAEPDAAVIGRYPDMPDRVVIKSFALTEGSSLPQIVRESRALECAKQLGLVFEHGMDDKRFYYVMPYRDGEHLGIVTRQLHGEAGGEGLASKQLTTVLTYVSDLVDTLVEYHRGGLWHKDVKPENIIIDDGGAHLVDLGLVTPLRSAMTLTTHGTEYFRDPEMVRQALRGVKVHQVDGAKFDIFAAGAVLYFMIENTFPPHGALSRFNKRSPDALKWIVRRAMADYNHRYTTADEMLADLRAVATAGDPFAVKPAGLPSMGGESPADAPAPAEGATVELPPARSPRPEPAFASMAGGMGVGAFTPAPAERSRPRLAVTNWWTGEYRVDDPSLVAAAEETAPGDDEQFRQHAADLRRQAVELRRKVGTGTMSARRAAREQLRTARARAKDMRRRAHTRRHRATAEREPSGVLAAVVFVCLLVIAAFAVLVYTMSRQSTAPMIVMDHGSGSHQTELIHLSRGAGERGRPVILVPSFDHADDPDIAMRLDAVAEAYVREGYDVVVNPDLADGLFGGLLETWRENDDEASDTALEDALEGHDFYGLLVVDRRKMRLGRAKLDDQIIRSTRGGASERRYHMGDAPLDALPYVFVNDHPAKHDPQVEGALDRLLRQYESRGWEIIVDDEVEVAVRKALPTEPLSPMAPLPMPLRASLESAGLGGVIYVRVGEGDGPPRRRVEVIRLDLEEMSSMRATTTREATTVASGGWTLAPAA